MLKHRVGRLERAAAKAGLGTPCPECGHREGAVRRVRIIPAPAVKNLAELRRREREEDTSNDACKTCGKRWVLRMRSPEIARIREAE